MVYIGPANVDFIIYFRIMSHSIGLPKVTYHLSKIVCNKYKNVLMSYPSQTKYTHENQSSQFTVNQQILEHARMKINVIIQLPYRLRRYNITFDVYLVLNLSLRTCTNTHHHVPIFTSYDQTKASRIDIFISSRYLHNKLRGGNF